MADKYAWESLIDRYQDDAEIMRRLSHDVRGQLHNILGNLSLIQMAFADDRFTADDKHAFAGEIYEAVQIIDRALTAAVESHDANAQG